MLRKLTFILLILAIWVLPAGAQTPTATPLRVEEAVTGKVTTQTPSVLYSFNVIESTRMGFIMDKTAGDMNLALVVFAQDGTTILAGSTGTNNNGVIVTFPTTGQYTAAVVGEGGATANYRLMIDADPPLPINTFVYSAYVVRGTSALCSEVEPAGFLTGAEDLGVCFTLALIQDPVEVTAQWWSPSGQIVAEESGTYDSSLNFQPSLTGIVYNGSQNFESGWWQVHFLINGELSHIQWVFVQ